jgi:hypothetical protein
MMQEFTNCFYIKTGDTFDVKHCQIRCFAHIVNLASQAVISARSKSKYYNGNPDDDHIPDDLGAALRDEVGIIRAICIKVRYYNLFDDLKR